MYVDQIRERLDEYEAETDPQRRLFIQLVIEGMAAGHIEPISISDMEQHADQRRK